MMLADPPIWNWKSALPLRWPAQRRFLIKGYKL